MSEKTEPPTGRRRAKAREEGQVARSHELNTAAVLIGGIWLLQSSGQRIIQDLSSILKISLTSFPKEFTSAWLRNLLFSDLIQLLPGLGTIIIGIMAIGIIVTVIQTGLLFSTKSIGFKFNRLNPLNGIKRIFSLHGVTELIKALLKLLLVGGIAYSYLQSQIAGLLELAQMDLSSGLSQWIGIAITLAFRVGLAYLALAIVDYLYNRWQFMKSLRMTKEEVKEEFKQSEGDPFIRGRIRAQQRRFARMRMMAKVPKADVIITNPTHLANAIQYDPKVMKAPVLLAKGAHMTAERIVEIAKKNNIPVVQNIPLARSIYRTVEIDQEIPPELYLAMAEVLAYVYKFRRKPSTPNLSPNAEMVVN